MSLRFLHLRMCYTLLLSVLSVLPCLQTSAAQSKGDSISLFNQKAAEKAEKKDPNDSGVMRAVEPDTRDYSIATAFQADTAESVLSSSKRSSDIFANYKMAAYLTYFRSVANVDDLLVYEEDDAVKHVLLLEGLRVSNERVVQPLMGDFYDQVLNQLRALRDRTTISVVKSGSGNFDLSQGGEQQKALVQFRIHASSRNGIEPRLTVADSVKLRLQPLEKKLLFELSFSF